ncbi:MAG: A/G-specific adenine glycosylase [Bacteroidales bacterium]
MNFAKDLILWFEVAHRQLPWRNTQDPYQIWVSEIILQQTRVIQGFDYFTRFIQRFPNIRTLAQAQESEVLKLWQGLGYYSRARNIHHAARSIMENFKGVFPREYTQIRALKGVGEYTAAAIASFAYKEAYPVVDGNVLRVMSRVFGIFEPIDLASTHTKIRIQLENLIDKDRPDLFNQAIMEFGALQCKPQNPLCDKCIFKLDCIAYTRKLTSELPIKTKKKELKDRVFVYFVAHNAQGVFLHKRKAKDIWQNMWEFPMLELNLAPLKNKRIAEENLSFYGTLCYDKQIVQCLSHQKLHISFYQCTHLSTQEWTELQQKYVFVKKNEISKYAMPKSIAEYLETIFKKN